MAHKYIKTCKNKAPNVILQHHNIQPYRGCRVLMYSTNVPAANKISHKQNPYCYDYCTLSKE